MDDWIFELIGPEESSIYIDRYKGKSIKMTFNQRIIIYLIRWYTNWIGLKIHYVIYTKTNRQTVINCGKNSMIIPELCCTLYRVRGYTPPTTYQKTLQNVNMWIQIKFTKV